MHRRKCLPVRPENFDARFGHHLARCHLRWFLDGVEEVVVGVTFRQHCRMVSVVIVVVVVINVGC